MSTSPRACRHWLPERVSRVNGGQDAADKGEKHAFGFLKMRRQSPEYLQALKHIFHGMPCLV
jgi:hypothetical protein